MGNGQEEWYLELISGSKKGSIMIYIQVASNLGVRIAFSNKLNYAKRE